MIEEYKTLEYGRADPEESGHWRRMGRFCRITRGVGIRVDAARMNLPQEEMERFAIHPEKYSFAESPVLIFESRPHTSEPCSIFLPPTDWSEGELTYFRMAIIGTCYRSLLFWRLSRATQFCQVDHINGLVHAYLSGASVIFVPAGWHRRAIGAEYYLSL